MDLTVFIYVIVLLFFLVAFIMLKPKKEEEESQKPVFRKVPKIHNFQNNYNKNPDLTRKQRRLLRIKRRLY